MGIKLYDLYDQVEADEAFKGDIVDFVRSYLMGVTLEASWESEVAALVFFTDHNGEDDSDYFDTGDIELIEVSGPIVDVEFHSRAGLEIEVADGRRHTVPEHALEDAVVHTSTDEILTRIHAVAA